MAETCRVCGREKADKNTDRAGYTPYPDRAGTPDVLCWAGVFQDGAHDCYRLGYERLLSALGPALRAQYVAGLEAALAAYEATAHDPCDHVRNAIREMAEQAKEGK